MTRVEPARADSSSTSRFSSPGSDPAARARRRPDAACGHAPLQARARGREGRGLPPPAHAPRAHPAGASSRRARCNRPLALRRIRRAVRRGVLRTRIVRHERRRSRLVLVTGAAAPQGRCGWPAGCWRPYADSSPFNRTLPPNPRVAPDSATIVRNLAERPDKVTVGNSGTSWDYSHPVYFSRPGDPEFTLHCYESWGRCADRGPAGPRAGQGAGRARRRRPHDDRGPRLGLGVRPLQGALEARRAAACSSSPGAVAPASTGRATAPGRPRPGSATSPGSSARRSSARARSGTRSSW